MGVLFSKFSEENPILRTHQLDMRTAGPAASPALGVAVAAAVPDVQEGIHEPRACPIWATILTKDGVFRVDMFVTQQALSIES